MFFFTKSKLLGYDFNISSAKKVDLCQSQMPNEQI